jgi:hypothetical protein
MVIFYLTILIFEILILTLIEKVLFKRYITPFTILAIPYLIIILLTVLAGPPLGFVNVYSQSILVWIVGLVIFWIPGIAIKWIFLENGLFIKNYTFNDSELVSYQNLKRWILLLAWIALLISLGGFLKTVSKLGINNLGNDEFTQFFGGGFSGHAMVFNIIPFIFLVGIVKRKDRFIAFTIILIFLTFFICQVKTWVIIPVLSGLFFRYYLGNLRFSIKTILIISIGGLAIFFSIYYISIGPNVGFLKKLFFEYLFAGTLGLSEHLRNDIGFNYDPFFLINPVRNIYNLLVGGEMKNVIQENYINIYSGNYVGLSNVRTLFGTILLNSSIAEALTFVFLISLICNFLFNIFGYFKNLLVMILTCFFLGGLAMGWFDLWFNHLNYYEITGYILILMIFSKVHLPGLTYKR